MADATYTITLSRWFIARVVASAWLSGCREFRVSPWSPVALAFLLRGLWVALFAWRLS